MIGACGLLTDEPVTTPPLYLFLISSFNLCFLCEYLVNSSICFVNNVGSLS